MDHKVMQNIISLTLWKYIFLLFGTDFTSGIENYYILWTMQSWCGALMVVIKLKVCEGSISFYKKTLTPAELSRIGSVLSALVASDDFDLYFSWLCSTLDPVRLPRRTFRYQ